MSASPNQLGWRVRHNDYTLISAHHEKGRRPMNGLDRDSAGNMSAPRLTSHCNEWSRQRHEPNAR